MDNVERRFSFGLYASGIAHVVLIAWLLLGWGLTAEPLPFEVTEVSVVSGEEYAQLVAATTPQPSTTEPVAPDPPAAEIAPAPDAALAEPPPDQAAPEAPPPATEEAPPDAPPPVDPPAEIIEEAPTQPPQPLEQAPPDPTLELAVRPQPRPVDRVAPEAVQPPPPDVAVSEVVQEALVPDETAPPADVVDPPVEAAAPEAAATEIVTEAEEPATAPTTAIRPPSRPERVAVAEVPVEDPAVETAVTEATAPEATAAEKDAVAAALAAALAGAVSEPAAAEGPPMTGSERDAFRVAVSSCWNVDVGSEAANVTVTVGFELGRDGKVAGDVRQIGGSGGSDAAIQTAFGAARRAILRCQQDGFQLPEDKYDQWREVEMTFDPNGMRLR